MSSFFSDLTEGLLWLGSTLSLLLLAYAIGSVLVGLALAVVVAAALLGVCSLFILAALV